MPRRGKEKEERRLRRKGRGRVVGAAGVEKGRWRAAAKEE